MLLYPRIGAAFGWESRWAGLPEPRAVSSKEKLLATVMTASAVIAGKSRDGLL